ncbi:MAG TPA: glycosyltransferase family 39 protein [Xanthobacteraceae bacterium]|nr:glycosyltransferase family 39 protein [Xanthobacteraceae bacterium]
MTSAEPPHAHIADRLALAVLAVATIVALATFRDYGLGWDDYAHAEYGNLLLSLYGSGLSDRRALSFVNLYEYGGGFDLVAALLAKVLPFSVFETRRLTGAIVGLLGLLVVWRTGRRVGGPLAGFIALTLLATCPLFVGHAFINAKDAPFAVAMAFLLLALVRAFEEYPGPSATTVVMVGLAAGLAIGTRILGGFGALYAIAALAMIVAIDARRNGMRIAGAACGRFLLRILPGLLLGYATMALVWPWSVAEPLNLIRALQYFSRFFEEPWNEVFGGALIRVTDMPRSYLPTLFVLQLPELFLALSVGGAIGALAGAFRRDTNPNRRAVLLLIALAGTLPIAIAVAMRPAMYNGVRHFLFVVPPLAVTGGLAGAWLFETLRQRGRLVAMAAGTIFVIGLALPVVDMVRRHPYEYTSFNRLAGGVAGARDRYMLDYWGLALKQASQGLAAKISELKLQKPNDRHWKLAVCGHHRAPQVELGPDFETTWDPNGADFAMMLGEYYCRKFDAPVLFEVVRDGVVYARVYDIRERSYDTLLTRPGLTGK